MAGFASQLTKFAPYVPQLPVDAYVKVGMYKQQQFDKGLQQVNQELTSLAGMPVDAKYSPYVQDKLNNLKNQINTATSGDFSDQQLIGHITRMATAITKDPTIKNALQSTAAIQQAQSDLEHAKTTGKGYGPSNEYILQRQIQAWKQDPNLNTPFTGGYTPYTDYNANFLKALKQADPNITENPYTTDQNGNKVLNPAMLKQTSLSPARIKAILSSAMTEADKTQMQIDGIYAFRNTSPEELQGMASRNYDSIIQQKQADIDTLTKVQQQLNPDDQVHQQEVDQSLKSLKADISDLTYQKSNISSTPLDVLKGQLYTTKYQNDLTQAYSNVNTQYVDNPILKLQMAQERLNLQYQRLQQQTSKKGNKSGGSDNSDSQVPGPTLAPSGAAGEVPQLPDDIIANAKNGLNSMTQGVKTLTQSIKAAHNLNDAQLAKMISEYKAGNQLPGIYQGDIESLLDITNKATRENSRLTGIFNDGEKKYDNDLKTALAGFHNYTVNGIEYTPQELAKFAVDYDSYIKNNPIPVFSKASATTAPTVTGVNNISAYTPFKSSDPKEQKLGEYFIQHGTSTALLSRDLIGDNVFRAVKDISDTAKDLIVAKNKYISDQILHYMPEYQEKYQSVKIEKPAEKDAIASDLSTFITSQTSGGEKLETSESGKPFKYDDARAKLSDASTKYSFESDGNGQYYYILSNPKISKDDDYIPATREQVERLTPNFVSPVGDIKTYYTNQLIAGGGYSTNINGNPLFTSYQFKGLQNQKDTKYNVTADLIKSATSNRYAIKLHINDANNPQMGTKDITVDPPEVPLTDNNLNAVEQRIAAITPAIITRLLYPTR